MKRHKIILLILTSMLIVMTGCQEYCSKFNYEIIDWMPYKKTDTIIIVNGDKTDSLIVNGSNIFHTHKAQSYGCRCYDSYTLSLSLDSLNVTIYFSNSGSPKTCIITIANESFSYSEALDKHEINGKVYSDLIILKRYEHGPFRFEKIIISKSIGIISIIGPNEVWTVKDDSKKTIDKSKINFSRFDCN